MPREITEAKDHATGLEFWRMTQAEYGELILAQGTFIKGMRPHKLIVQLALLKGKPVPEKVLAGYPELRRTKKEDKYAKSTSCKGQKTLS